MNHDDLVKIAGGIAAPLIATGIAYLKEMRERRGQSKALKLAMEQVTFWKLLVEAQAGVLEGTSLEQARNNAALQFALAGMHVANALASEQSAQSESSFRPPQKWRRLFFFYKPPAKWLWLLRIYYYFCIFSVPYFAVDIYIDNEDFSLILIVLIISQSAWSGLIWLLTRYNENQVFTSKKRHESAHGAIAPSIVQADRL